VSKSLNNSIHKSRNNISHYRENLRRRTCMLLSRILSIFGETAFSIDTEKFANMLHQGLVELPKDSTEWNDAIAYKNTGSVLIILLYYHFLGTREYEKKKKQYFSLILLVSFINITISISFFRNDMISLDSLITRVMLLPKFLPISVLILKPLWLLFAVSTYLSRACLRYALIALFDFAGNVSISSAS